MKAKARGWLLLAISLASAPSPVAWSAQEKADGGMRWQYRVLSKEQVLELGKKDLALGLNKLGDEGWELAGVDGAYIFKRPRDHNRRYAAELEQRIRLMEAVVEMQRERILWAERMARKGFLSNQTVEGERQVLQRAEMALQRTRKELKALPGASKAPAEKEGKPPK
jgi:hypothetical protein